MNTATLTKLWFVDSKGRPRPVCQRKHKPGKVCKRHHAVPAGSLWSGQVDQSLRGELLEMARESRKTYSRAMRRWRNKRKLLAAKRSSAAAAFRSYVEALLHKHDGQMPTLSIEIEASRLVEGTP